MGKRELVALLCLSCLFLLLLCSVALSLRAAVGLSAVSDCGIS